MSVLTEPGFACEPLTPRGVAAFARASFERLLVVQSVSAVIATAVIVWIVSAGVFPTVEIAINSLPDQGGIRSGKLDWRGKSPVMLAEGAILALSVNLDHDGSLRSPADFQIEFGRDTIRVFSLFGAAEFPYPAESFGASRREVRPAWGAWSPNFLALAAIGIFFGLLALWSVLASLYLWPLWIISYFFDRGLSLGACWKLAGAVLMPGALWMSFSILLYGLGIFDIVKLCFAAGMHIVIGWIYLFISPVFLMRVPPPVGSNPFAAK